MRLILYVKGSVIMIYSVSNRDFSHFVDRQRTGNYGEKSFKSRLVCDSCGGIIKTGDSYYMFDDAVYCMNCAASADERILCEMRENYIYVF